VTAIDDGNSSTEADNSNTEDDQTSKGTSLEGIFLRILILYLFFPFPTCIWTYSGSIGLLNLWHTIKQITLLLNIIIRYDCT